MSSRRTTTRSLYSAGTGGSVLVAGTTGEGYFDGSYRFSGNVVASGFFNTCSRLKKEKIQRDALGKKALESSLGITMYSYRYLDPPYETHIGPMAEELRNASELFRTHVIKESEDGHLQVSPCELNYVRTEALKARTDELNLLCTKMLETQVQLTSKLTRELEKAHALVAANTTYIDQLNARLRKSENKVRELEHGADELKDTLRRYTTSFFSKWFCRGKKSD